LLKTTPGRLQQYLYVSRSFQPNSAPYQLELDPAGPQTVTVTILDKAPTTDGGVAAATDAGTSVAYTATAAFYACNT